MTRHLHLIVLIAVTIPSTWVNAQNTCAPLFAEQPAVQVGPNPFLIKSPLIAGAPDFASIRPEHFLPAVKDQIQLERKCIQRIKDNPQEATFKNVFTALENCPGQNLAAKVLSHLSGVDSKPELLKIQREVTDLRIAFFFEVFSDKALFERVKHVRENSTDLSAVKQRLIETFYEIFISTGIEFTPEVQQQLQALQTEEAQLSQQFGDNVLTDEKARAIWLPDATRLKGLPQPVIDVAAQQAPDYGHTSGYVIDLNSVALQVMEFADDRSLREQVWRAQFAAATQGDRNNEPIIRRLLKLRTQSAALLDFKTHAHLKLHDRMAQTPEKVLEFLRDLRARSVQKYESDLAELAKLAAVDGATHLEPWDHRYYVNKIKQKTFNIDPATYRDYFEVTHTTQKLFELIKQLYGVTFVQDDSISTPHKDVRAFQVLGRRGNLLGLLYMDLHARPSKRSGAWMSTLLDQSYHKDKRVPPIVTVNANFQPLAASGKGFLSLDDVRTLYHEMGHALHGLFSNVPYKALASPNVAWDFVELPSQLMENWLEDGEYLQSIGVHHETGTTIPQEMVDAAIKSKLFMNSLDLTRYLGMALADMNLHLNGLPDDWSLAHAEKIYSDGIWHAAYDSSILYTFGHLFDGGYDAGYYSYWWAKILDSDVFGAFREGGLTTPHIVASQFRQEILSQGNAAPAEDLFRNFRGRDPDSRFYLMRDGLINPAEASQ